jgi:rhodanese-related sulfurtransferase
MNISNIIKSGKGKIVDVRSVGEFASGHIQGSLNIPLDQVSERLEEFKALEEPILAVCASGNRSGMAAMMLQREGIECFNAGGWSQLEYQLSMLKAS